MISGTYTLQYVVKGVEPYKLEVHFSIENLRIDVIGGNLVRPGGRYVGFWNGDQMPKQLLKEIKQGIRNEVKDLIVEIE